MEKLIEWQLDDIIGELRRISLVSKPAIEQEFMLFNSAVDLDFKTIDDEKRVVTGAAMRPNIKIPRRTDDGELYYGFFSENTVRKAAELFFKKGSNMNETNIEHEFDILGVYVFESWIVEDPEVDKAKALGFSDIRKGDWFVSMKVENEDVWNNYLKTGLIKGYSVEIRTEEKIISDLMNIFSKYTDDDDIIEKIIKIIYDAEDSRS